MSEFLFEVETCKKKAPPIALCGICGMKHCHNPDVGKQVVGKGKKGIMILMSHPEICEDNTGAMWEYDNTQSGTLMGNIVTALQASGLDLERDCWRTNAVACCPRSCDREKLIDSAGLCRPNLMAHIKRLQPKVIIAMGTASIKGLYGDRCADDIIMYIDSWHGFAIPDRELGAWVLPCYDSSTLSEHFVAKDSGYVQRDTAKLVLREISKVANKACKIVKRGKAPTDYFSKALKAVVIDSTPQKATAFLKGIRKGDKVAFDFESSSIKPDSETNFLKCVSVYSDEAKESHCFEFDSRNMDKNLKAEFIRIMRDKEILKIGQNIKMEERWSRAKLGCRVKGWEWDCMLTSHYLHSSKRKVTGLKFETGVNFGIFRYNERVDKYLKTPLTKVNRGGNTTNCVDKADKFELMKYCALDSLFTFWLYKKQLKQLETWKMGLDGAASCLEGNKFLLKSVLTFCDMEEVGAFIDIPYLEGQREECRVKVENLLADFKKTKIFAQWKKEFGNKANPMSGDQLRTILYKKMGLVQKKKTESGEDSTDKEAILSLGIPDLVPLAEAKLLEKARGTYISSIIREVVDNFLHTSLNLHVPATFRSSSSDPNLQNLPIRNKNIGIIIRGAFVSRFGKDGVIIEADLKGAEVSASACYHKDKRFMSYITDPKNDMHKDTMGLILKATPAQVTKDLRHIAKNKFVFPEFYGDWFKSCTENIWQEMQKLKLVDGTPVMLHLQDQGIVCLPKGWKEGDYLIQEKYPKPYSIFENHMKEVEHIFWYEMFPDYTEWKDFWYKKYLNLGYVESLTGFRYTGILDRKQTINYPIQGTAYHLNQKGANMMNIRLRKDHFRTLLFNQIHDSQLFDSHVEEYEEVIRRHNHIMNVELRKIYPWINVPIVVEFEVTEPGASWFHKKPYELKAS